MPITVENRGNSETAIKFSLYCSTCSEDPLVEGMLPSNLQKTADYLSQHHIQYHMFSSRLPRETKITVIFIEGDRQKALDQAAEESLLPGISGPVPRGNVIAEDFVK